MNIYNIYEKKILEVLKSKTAKHEEEMMKSNFVQLSWNDTSKKVLEAGTYIVPFADGVKYRLLDNYEPKQKTEASFEYAPEFQHPIMMLGKIPFILTTGDTTSFQTADKETDWVYTGVASTIIQKIVDYINIIGAEIPDIGTGWFAVIDADIIGSKTCTFSAMDVLSAISECCNQWSCEYYLHYETKALYFGKVGIGDAVTLKVGENIGIPSVSESKEGYYNAFLVKGSTRNISQRSASGENTSVNKRLTLDPVKYPYGYIDKRENTAEPLMVKELIFEEVYPKLDLYVYNPRCRTRYLKDDDGNTVPGIDGKPKKYAVWYIRLAYLQNGVWMDYKITDDVVLSNKYQADNVGYYYNRYGNADHLTYKYAVFTNADFDAKWFTNKVTCQTSYSQYYVTVKAGDIVETAIAINNNGTLVLLIGESYTNYNSARNDSRGKAFRLAAQKDGIILQKYITEANIPSNYRHSQILDGMELSMSFQANENENALPSPLAGQEFKLRYHKEAKTIRANTEDGDSGMSVLAGDFEIVFEEGDIIIPTTIDGELYPRGERTPSLTGNKAILFNLAMDDRYKAQAYLDLETTANKEIERLCSDLNNYTFPSNPVVFEKELTNPHLHVGMKVKYDDGQGYTLDTRVLKLVTQLDFEFKQSITVGNGQIKGTISELREQIQQISTGGGGTGSGGGVNISELKNMLMYYGRNYFLSKQSDDYTPYNLGIGKTLNVGENVNVGKDLHVNGLLTAYNAVMNTIRSSNYTGDGVADSGWSITNDYAGSSRLVVDYLYARKKAVFESLGVKELEFSSGDKAQSLASATLERTDYLEVDEQGNETLLGYSVQKIPWTLKGFMMRLSGIKPYALAGTKRIRITLKPEDLQRVNRIRCYFLAKDDDRKIRNLWKENDLARCQTFNIDNIDRETYAGDTHKEGNVYWWRLVKGYSTEVVTLDGKDYHYFDVAYGYTEEQEANSTGVRTSWCDLLSDLPAAGDKVVQFGNTSNPARMNIIVSEVNGEGNVDAPAIKSYRGVHTFNTDDDWWGGESCRKMMLSPSSGVEFYAPSFKFITEYGIERAQVERGAWLSIPFEEDKEHQTFPDYSDDILDENGNFVSRSDGSAKKYVRKCRYYDNVEHKGSSWRCTIADSHYWRYYDVKSKTWSKITDAQYKALSSDEKARCEEVRNYTTDEPSKASNDWTVSAERGADGSFKSRVFCRTNTNIKNANVSGGSYDNPIPTQTKIGDDVVQITWEDGVPQGTEMLWSTVCAFYGDGSNSGWSKPSQETDTETLDIEYSPNAQQPANPTGTAADRNTSATIAAREQQGWYDPSRQPADQQMVWRAECKIKNGVYETKDGQPAWVVSRILGEKGEKGSYYVDDYGIGASRTSHSDISSWSSSQPSPTSQKPYVWKRSRLYNPNTNTYGTATYVCLTGERGPGGESTETISVYKAQSAKPSKPTGTTVPPSGWSLVPVEGSASVDLTYSYTGNWTRSGNVLTSNAIDNNGITKERVSFTSTGSVKVKVKLTASSEYNYDFVLIGNPDEDNVTRTSNYMQRVSGSGSVEVELDFSGAGSHFFVVAYAKDGSSTSGSDNGQFEILGAYESNSTPIWVSTGKLVNNVSDGVWSDPVRWNGKDGTDGSNGVNGKDGWMITANPANVIITQSLGSSTSSFSSATVSFAAKKGNVSAVIASIGTPTSSQFDVSKSGNTVVVSSPQTHGSPAEYYTEGSFKVNINVTDPDTGSTVTFSDFTVPCYANLLGTWKREVEAGVETVVAGLTRYLEDEDGNIITSESLRNDINDATQDLSTLSQTVTSQGQTIQNQNTRLSTAERNISTVTGKVNGLETSVSQISQTADEIKMSVNRGYRNYILNPKATDATTGRGTMSKVSDPVMGNVMNVYNSGSGDFQLICEFDDDNRSDLSYKVVTCYAVVKPKSSGSGIIHFGTWSANQQKPGLVVANSTAEGVVSSVSSSESGATTGMVSVGNGWYIVWSSFNARSVFSERKESVGINSVNGSRWLVYGYGIVVGNTCPTLEAILTNTGLRSAGIDISDGTVNLYGDKVTFSNSTGTVSGKVWIDPDDGTIHAVNGHFSGKITATSGTIGGFTIDPNRLYNSDWNAGIDINYDGKTVKIGKNAQGVMNTEDAIIRVENTKVLGGAYNTALYLNASGATYNYAFYGNGNGVLNGLMFGYKVHEHTIWSGSSDTFSRLYIGYGSTIILKGSHSEGIVSLAAPQLSEVRKCLGINSSTTPFAIEFTVVSHASYEFVNIVFKSAITQTQSDEYPWLMNGDGGRISDGNIQIAQGDVVKILLVYDNVGTTNSPYYEYRAYDLIRRV